MTRWILATMLFLPACGGEVGTAPPDPPRPEPDTQVPATPAPEEPADGTEHWLRELLAYDLESVPSDERTMVLGQQLHATVTCPQPGTGCYVELPLGGLTAQVHVGDDQVIQVWGPNEPFQMGPWVGAVEEDVDRSSLRALNTPGTRPDRLWRSEQRIVLLHDHSEQPCDGFCPSMIWIARPGHPDARGYGFEP